MPIYEYKCDNCGKTIEHVRHLVENSRHLDGEGVCGTLKRVWQVNINKENIRAVPRG